MLYLASSLKTMGSALRCRFSWVCLAGTDLLEEITHFGTIEILASQYPRSTAHRVKPLDLSEFDEPANCNLTLNVPPQRGFSCQDGKRFRLCSTYSIVRGRYGGIFRARGLPFLGSS